MPPLRRRTQKRGASGYREMKKFTLSPFFFGLLSASVVILDRLSKLWVQGAIPPGEIKSFIGHTLCLTHVHNLGGAFGLMPNFRIIFLIMGFLIPLLIVIFYKKIALKGPAWLFAASLILGGAVGNLIDRVALGYVVDFLDFRIGGRNVWPIFNIADIAVTKVISPNSCIARRLVKMGVKSNGPKPWPIAPIK